MTTICETETQSVPYYNLSIDQGFSYVFSLESVDDTGSPLDLTGCIITFTACEIGSPYPAFVLTNATSDIVVDFAGLVTITVPETAGDNILSNRAAYDVVITDLLGVSKTMVRGFITITPALY